MNGHAAALIIARDPIQPAKAPAPTEVEQRIGAAVADAAAALGQGLADCEGGGTMTKATKMLGSVRLAKVAALQLAHYAEFDFATLARQEGLRELHRRHDGVFREAKLDDAMIERGLSEIVGWVIGISAKVCADERALAH
jgi:hypothetical protein